MAVAVLAVAAIAGTGIEIANYEQGQQAAAAQKSLANQQASQLQQEQDNTNALAAAEAISGETFGFPTNHPAAGVLTGVGYGSAPKPSANQGSGSVTGMG